jgi:transposase
MILTQTLPRIDPAPTRGGHTRTMNQSPRSLLIHPAAEGPIGDAIRRLAQLLEYSDKVAQKRMDQALGGNAEGSWVAQRAISAKSWLVALQCFELDLNVRETAKLAEVSVPTAHKTRRTIREALAAQDPHWGALAAQADSAPLLFGVHEGVSVTTEPIICMKTVAEIQATPPAVLHGKGFTYAEGMRGYDAITFGGKRPGHFTRRAPRGSRSDFLAFLINRVTHAFGVSRAEFPLYLKEWEFRFNHRQEPLFEALLAGVCRTQD